MHTYTQSTRDGKCPNLLYQARNAKTTKNLNDTGKETMPWIRLTYKINGGEIQEQKGQNSLTK